MKARLNAAQEDPRSRIIIRTSAIGILANLFLTAFKAVVGLATHSIAIVLDAVNNLSDAASSLITIIGTRLAGREPDKKHPFGHGRIEYLSAMLISVLVLYAGLTSLVESVRRILAPQTPSYTAPSLVIVGVGVVVKVLLGRYVKATGKRVHSDSLINSGEDATLDSVISAATLAAAAVYLLTGLSLEAWLGALISLVIVKSGFEMLRDTVSRLLGEPADLSLVQDIKKTVLSFPGVLGAYDLVLNDYGPDAWNGSIHVEVPDTCHAFELDELLRAISREVYLRHRVLLTAIGVYSVNTTDEEAIQLRESVRKIVLSHEGALEMHGFYLDRAHGTLRFDIVISFDVADRQAIYEHILRDVQDAYPAYRLEATMDADFGLT